MFWIEQGKLQYQSFRPSLDGRKELVGKLRGLTPESDGKLFAAWAGKQTNELYVLDIPTAIGRLDIVYRSV